MDSGKIGRSCLEKGLRKGRGGHGEVKGMASDYWARGLFLKLYFIIFTFTLTCVHCVGHLLPYPQRGLEGRGGGLFCPFQGVNLLLPALGPDSRG
jgi:hypothetical protein